MKSKPKPTKESRVREKAKRLEDLRAYRREQVAIAILRDNDQCAIHFFLHGENRRREEVHHIYSRGRQAGDFREHYTSLLCVCKECHPMAIQTPGASATLGWVEEIARKANETPINTEFRHVEQTV